MSLSLFQAPSTGTPCHMCGTIQGGKPGKGKEKALGKSPPMKARMNKSCRDMSTQTNVSPVLHKKEVINMTRAYPGSEFVVVNT